MSKRRHKNKTSNNGVKTESAELKQVESGAGESIDIPAEEVSEEKVEDVAGEAQDTPTEENASKQDESTAGKSEDSSTEKNNSKQDESGYVTDKSSESTDEDDDIELEDATDNAKKESSNEGVVSESTEEQAEVTWVDDNGNITTDTEVTESVAEESLAEIEKSVKESVEEDAEDDDYVPKHISFFGWVLRFLVIFLAFLIVFVGVKFCQFMGNLSDDGALRSVQLNDLSFDLNSQYGVAYKDSVVGVTHNGTVITSITESSYNGVNFDKALKDKYGDFKKTNVGNYTYYILESSDNVSIVYLFKNNDYLAFNISTDIKDTSKYYKSFTYKGIKIDLEEEYAW